MGDLANMALTLARTRTMLSLPYRADTAEDLIYLFIFEMKKDYFLWFGVWVFCLLMIKHIVMLRTIRQYSVHWKPCIFLHGRWSKGIPIIQRCGTNSTVGHWYI